MDSSAALGPAMRRMQWAAVPPHSPLIGNGMGADGVKLQCSSCSSWTAAVRKRKRAAVLAAAEKECCSACSISEGVPRCLG